MNINGFRILEVLTEHDQATVARATRESDGAAVVLKVFQDLDHAQEEAEILTRVAGTGVPKSYGIVQTTEGPTLVMQDAGKESLADRTKRGRLDLREVVRLATELARAVDHVHHQGVMHLDIKPHNVLMGTEDGRLSLVDFGLARALGRTETDEEGANRCEDVLGTLGFCPPEQTGRTSAALDRRSDLYGVGSTIYFLLTGKAPIDEEEPLEAVAATLSRKPEPLDEACPWVPRAFAAIVERLLNKSAEDRYQRADGLVGDLERCAAALARDEVIPEFELGLDDYRELELPPPTFGRDRAIEELNNQLARKGASFVTVRTQGDCSVGELVEAVFAGRAMPTVVTANPGDRPLAIIHEMLEKFGQTMLNTPRKIFDRIISALARSVGDIGGVLIELEPSLEKLLGPQPPLAKLGPAETKARLELVFRRVAAALSEIMPNVLVVENFEHIDPASRSLVEAWSSADDSGHSIVFGALSDPKAKGLPHAAAEIRIKRLDPAMLVTGVARTLGREASEVGRITEVLARRTRGNPTHMAEVVAHWADLGVLRRRDGRWTWDDAALDRAPMPASLSALLADRVCELDERTTALAEVLACFGRAVPAAEVAKVAEIAEADVSTTFALLSDEGFVSVDDGAWTFAHPAITEAVRQQTAESRSRALHTKIGRDLLGQRDRGTASVDAFTLAEHLRRGEPPKFKGEREAFAAVYLEAGTSALGATAFDEAQDFFERVLTMVEGDLAGEHGFEASLWKARCAAMLGQVEVADAGLGELARFDLSPGQVARCFGARAEIANAALDRDGAVARILEGLERLGMKIPARPSKLQTIIHLLKQERKLSRRNRASLVESPEATDPVAAAKMALVSDLLAPAYLTDPNLFLYSVESGIELFLAHGRVPSVAFLLSAHAMVLRGALKKLDRALEVQETAEAIDERAPAPAWRGKMAVGAFFTFSIFRSLDTVIELLDEGAKAGLETGDTLFAAYSAHNAAAMMVFDGASAASVVKHVQANTAAHAGEHGVELAAKITHDVFSAWLEGDADNQEIIARIDAVPESIGSVRNDIIVRFVLPMVALGERGAARRWVEAILPTYEKVSMGMPAFYEVQMWQGIFACDDARAGRRRARRLAASMARSLRRSTKSLHPRYQMYPALLEAELAHARGQLDLAAARYGAAHALALEHGQTLIMGYASERRAELVTAQGREAEGLLFLREAHRAYRSWGLKSKTKILEASRPELVSRATSATRGTASSLGSRSHGSSRSTASRSAAGSRTGASAQTGRSRATATTSLGQSMDLRTVLDVSREISTKVRVDDVVKAVLGGVASNAGARRAALVHVRGNRELVLARCDEERHYLVGRVVADCPDVSDVAVDLVSRTGEPLVVEDARSDARFSDDAGVIERGVRSLACVPLKNQGKTVGYIYLENELIEGAFTADRLAILDMVSSQAAISLENAALYSQLEARVAARTAELSARNEEMRVVLDNVTEGLLVLDREGKISSERSAIVDTWLHGEVPGTFTALLSEYDADAQVWFDMGWEELSDGIMPLELCLDQLPARISIDARTVDLRWRAISDQDGGFKQLLVVMTDVTAELARRRTEAANRELMEIFERSTKDHAGYVEFVLNARDIVARLEAGEGTAAEQFRWIHTLKGNCAVQGLISVADACHDIETELAAEGRSATRDEVEAICAAWAKTDANIRTFVDTEADDVIVARTEYEAFVQQLEGRAPELATVAAQWTLEPLADRLDRFAEQARALAVRLGKGDIDVEVDADGLRHEPEAWADFWQNFVHVVRNAVDHGLEDRAGRVAAGKGTATLVLSCRVEGENFVLQVADDGGGIDWDAVKRKAAAAGIPTATQSDLVAALFTDGLSTRDEATDTSGRGVGMAAVAASCEALGGRYDVASDPGAGTTFTFTFPASRLGAKAVVGTKAALRAA